jgi:hypothetical protein
MDYSAIILGDHKRNVQFRNDTENTAYSEPPHTHTSQQKTSQSFILNVSDDWCFCAPPLDVTNSKMCLSLCVCDASVDSVRTRFQHSPQKSKRRATRELQLPQAIVSIILCKRLLTKLCDFNWSALWKQKRRLARKVHFSYEATFHINDKVSRHNVCVWRVENLHAILEHERDSPK